MVARLILHSPLLLAQVDSKPQMPETTKAAALMALLGIALLGMLIVVIILLGGHWVRRLGDHRRGPVVPPDFVLKPADSSDDPVLPDDDQSTGETTLTQDTKNG